MSDIETAERIAVLEATLSQGLRELGDRVARGFTDVGDRLSKQESASLTYATIATDQLQKLAIELATEKEKRKAEVESLKQRMLFQGILTALAVTGGGGALVSKFLGGG